MAPLPFKLLTLDSILEPDPVSLGFANTLDRGTGEISRMSREAFIGNILEPRLIDRVPQEVREVFESGRGAMCYGYFFYPLFMLGFEQACRAAETAIKLRTRQLEGPPHLTFQRGIEFLVDERVIAASAYARWNAIRTLRNEAAHPKFQQIQPPGPSVQGLLEFADAINELFDGLP